MHQFDIVLWRWNQHDEIYLLVPKIWTAKEDHSELRVGDRVKLIQLSVKEKFLCMERTDITEIIVARD